VCDAKDIGMAPTEAAAMLLTRRRLAMDQKIARIDGAPPQIVEAFRSEEALLHRINSDKSEQTPTAPDPINVAAPAWTAVDIIVGVRLNVPDDDDEDDALARAIDIATDSVFCERRRAVHDWQRQKVEEWRKKTEPGGVLTVTEAEIQAAGKELDRLIELYNEKAVKAANKRRTETAILVATLGTAAVGGAAILAPALFAFAALGSLGGQQVAQLAVLGTGGFLQCLKHRLARSEIDASARVPAVGAMFHQLETDDRWKRRLRGPLPFLLPGF
jgi:hypothetical protein